MNISVVPQDEAFNIALLLESDASDETILKYRKIDFYNREEENVPVVQTFDELPQSYFVHGHETDNARPRNADTINKECCKSFQASRTATYDAVTFLSDGFAHFKPQKKGKRRQKTVSPGSTMLTGNAAFIIGRSKTADSTFRSPQYHAVTFSLPRPVLDNMAVVSRFQDFHELLMIRQPGLQRNGPMSLSKDLFSFDTFDAVQVCTGMCLFSEQNLDSCIQSGAIQPSRLAQLPVSLSEKDIIIRLSTTITNTVSLYLHGSDARMRRPFQVNVDIPSAQYYKDALQSYSDGKCNGKAVLEWIVAIKTRRRLLFGAFVKAIQCGLEQRCISKDSVDIALSCGLKAADEGIFSALHASSTSCKDWLQLVLNSALGDGDEFWPEFISLVGDNDRNPSSWRQLSTLSYMYEVVKPALRARSIVGTGLSADIDLAERPGGTDSTVTTTSATPSSKSTDSEATDFFDAGRKSNSASVTRILLLAIDDFDESRIYTKAYESLCRLSTASARSPGASPLSSIPVVTRIVTICPAPRIVVGASGSDPNWTRPSLWRASIRSGNMNGDTLQIRNEENLLESDSDILGKVYNKDLVTQLDGWVKK